jgi:hypothetical protein
MLRLTRGTKGNLGLYSTVLPWQEFLFFRVESVMAEHFSEGRWGMMAAALTAWDH